MPIEMTSEPSLDPDWMERLERTWDRLLFETLCTMTVEEVSDDGADDESGGDGAVAEYQEFPSDPYGDEYALMLPRSLGLGVASRWTS